jgi:hypothetical protein
MLQLVACVFCGDCGIPGRMIYRKRKDRMFDLHVVQYGGEFLGKGVQLRDYVCIA